MQNKKKVFISTGGFKDKVFTDVIKKFKKGKIDDIELSGGCYTVNSGQKILQCSKKANIRAHNYFPPPKKPFVINLASSNPKIANLSLAHVVKGINLSAKINAKYFSFHGGFRLDPLPKHLGKTLKEVKIINKKKALNIFKKQVLKISKIAKKKNITILIENNVVTKNNLDRFKINPLLLTDPKDICSFFKKLPKNIGLLLDVGHLKVSSVTERFDLKDAIKVINKYVKGYHFNDNNGLVDSNKSCNKNSWFLKYINKDLDYYTLEVYTKNIKTLYLQKKFFEKYLN